MPTRDERRESQARREVTPNAPHYTLAAGVLLVLGGLVVAAVTGADSLDQLLGLIVTAGPALLAAGYAERASRDIRNGTVREKVRQGTHQALEEVGVPDVVEAAGRGQGSILAMQALAALLEDRGIRADDVAPSHKAEGPPR